MWQVIIKISVDYFDWEKKSHVKVLYNKSYKS